MKKKTLTILIGALLTTAGFTQTLNKKNLSKKWYLEKYEHNWVDYAPEENEANDYILLKANMRYESVSEGKKSFGKWKINQQHNLFILFDNQGNALKCIVNKLSVNKLVFNLDIQDMEAINIHYTTLENAKN